MTLTKRKKRGHFSSAQVITASFSLIIIIGAVLLSLPIASTTGHTDFIDAFFVAVSATCVTGLTPVNTAAHWTLFGRTVILILVEIGGMSFLLMSLLVLFSSKKKASFSTRLLIKDYLNLDMFSGVFQVAKYTLSISFAIQAIGAFLLSFHFVPEKGLVEGLGFSVFHAVSAFCNAGFDLLGDSLESSINSPFLLVVLSLLVIAGGLGFIVWKELLTFRKHKKLSLHSSLTLRATLFVLGISFVLFYVFEAGFTRHASDLTFVEKISNILFLSATPRTAGFNNIPYADVSSASLVLTIVLMFIGGNSGSTAGGLKVSTLSVLFLGIRSILSGKEHVSCSGRTIKRDIVDSSFALFFLALVLVASAITVLTVTETVPSGFGIEYIAFEVFSAFGTVGISMGLTPHLSFAGKIIIMLVMFIGRIGIYTFIFSLIKKRQTSKDLYKYPEEYMLVG
ncbi:TrkH family potassium uptake protein [Vagococcus acidifermentans]|uniref:Trk family potassium uptake protein n=1 Tax=Vagococcus acidifermentans TaxID=564710 RepID=A0A430AQN3_9ENTE|nr:potassium transporter TrkG [Vagococcus acidifermentans]RSU10429.1 Trk family potassium uptake protein [Vagococcus acidifermentans]